MRSKPVRATDAFDEAAVSRFWSKVDRGTVNECWSWKTAKRADGYGKFFAAGREYGAHRYSLLLVTKAVDDPNVLALHSCGNRACVNPHHLRWGTRKDNADDAQRDGSYRGRRIGSRLSSVVVNEILKSGLGCKRLGKALGLPHQTVAAVRKRNAS